MVLQEYSWNLAAISSVRFQEYSCSTTDVVGPEASTDSSGSTTLRWDADGNQFVYNWQTPKTSMRCYTLTVRLADGASKSARFMTK